MRPEILESALQRNGASPIVAVLQAGEFNTGNFDCYRDLIPVAKRYSAWVHIDGAFGMWAAASDAHRRLLDGAQGADSWATDGHKWLNVPYDCGYAFVANAAAHRAAMSYRASYLVHDEEARDQIDWTPDWSRRARGFATYAALRQLGRSGIASLIERCCSHAKSLVDGLAPLPGVQVLWRPIINQGLVRFLSPHPGATGQDHDGYTDCIVRRIAEHGGAFFMGTTWRGGRAMRISVLNSLTEERDVERAIQTVADCLAPEYANGRHFEIVG